MEKLPNLVVNGVPFTPAEIQRRFADTASGRAAARATKAPPRAFVLPLTPAELRCARAGRK